MPKLKIQMPEAGEVTHEMLEPVITLGRLPENTIQITDGSVSSRHAQLSLGEDGNYYLQDLGSTNGTRVNGSPITESPLSPGDRVRFGHVECTYQGDGAADDSVQPLPAAEQPVAMPAAESHRPANFANASPFQKKTKKTDPAGKAIMIFSILAILLILGAVIAIFLLQPPPALT